MMGSAMRDLTPTEQTDYRHLVINARAQWAALAVVIAAAAWFSAQWIGSWLAFALTVGLHTINAAVSYLPVHRFQLERLAPPPEDWSDCDCGLH